MEINCNFNKSYERIVNAYEPLASWFERNQETMAYFEFTHAGCTHFENTLANNDVIVLGRMADAAFICMDSKKSISSEDKAKLAAMAIATVYQNDSELLSDTAKELYYIDAQTLEDKCEKVRTRK